VAGLGLLPLQVDALPRGGEGALVKVQLIPAGCCRVSRPLRCRSPEHERSGAPFRSGKTLLHPQAQRDQSALRRPGLPECGRFLQPDLFTRAEAADVTMASPFEGRPSLPALPSRTVAR
jgi:hypothetical protein